MKSVLLACKSITEESEAIERAGVLNESDKMRLHSGKEALSASLSYLLDLAKDNASGGSSFVGMDDAIERLTQSMTDLVNIMQRYENKKASLHSWASPPNKWSSPPNSPHKDNSQYRSGMDLIELKVFLIIS